MAYTPTTDSSNSSAVVAYVSCSKGFGSSLESGKGFGFNLFDVKGVASNASGTAISNQTLGVRYPSAPC